MATSGGAKPSGSASVGARSIPERGSERAGGRTGMTLAERLRAERKAEPAKSTAEMTPAERLAEKLKADRSARAAPPPPVGRTGSPSSTLVPPVPERDAQARPAALETSAIAEPEAPAAGEAPVREPERPTAAAVEVREAAEARVGEAPEPSDAFPTPPPVAVEVREAAEARVGEPFDAFPTPPPVAEDAGLDEPRRAQSVWLVVAGAVVLLGVPGAWLATRGDPPPTMAAVEGEPEPAEPEPQPPEPVVEPPPVRDDADAPGGAPAARVAVPEPTQPLTDDDFVQNAQVAQSPSPTAEARPAPAPVAARVPTPQEKARELIRAGDKAYAAGQVAKAEGKYEAALAESPRAHAAAVGLGRIAFNQSDYAGAARHYGRAVKLSAGNGEYRILYGDALFKLGKYADAKVQYAKAKSLGNGQADRRLEKVRSKLGR